MFQYAKLNVCQIYAPHIRYAQQRVLTINNIKIKFLNSNSIPIRSVTASTCKVNDNDIGNNNDADDGLIIITNTLC